MTISVVAPPTNGSCAATHYNCAAGTLGATAEYSNSFQWWCDGTNGGSNVLCTEWKASCSYTGPLSWSPGCSANSTWSTSSGNSVTITNTTPGLIGSEQYSCNNGSWSGPTNQSCTSSCVPSYNSACTSPANACGQTNTGTYSCTGTCSASTPSNPAGYGSACTSAANACGQTNTGTYTCSGTCSASTPSNSSCPGPTASLSASPTSVAYGGQATLYWSETNATSCSAGGPWSNQGTLSGSGWTNPLYSNTTFSFQCFNVAGTASPVSYASVSVTAPPPASCSATTIGSCNLSSTSSGGSSGSCSSGYVGSCSYSCSNGTWSVSS
ncbi:MAG TPA: hypothetical protein VMV62_00400, partial [Candidatus Paceibacterota bacterium]|nr:hypothetical protein [Candidatus Paceibacterota bacterium]